MFYLSDAPTEPTATVNKIEVLFNPILVSVG